MAYYIRSSDKREECNCSIMRIQSNPHDYPAIISCTVIVNHKKIVFGEELVLHNEKAAATVAAAALPAIRAAHRARPDGLFAFLFAFGPIIAMLIIVGLDQGGQNSISSTRTWATSSSSPRKKKDLNRKLAPSYKRAYDRLIGYVQARGGEIKSRDDGIRRLNELGSFDAERFFSSPYVIKTLGLASESTSKKQSHVNGDGASNGSERKGSGDFSEIEGDDWWEKGYEEGTEKSTQKTDPSGDSCGDSQCSNPVSAFDFRCFTCRRRFCSEHAGANIECSECSK